MYDHIYMRSVVFTGIHSNTGQVDYGIIQMYNERG